MGTVRGRRRPRRRQPLTAGTLPAATAGEAKLLPGRMEAGGQASITSTRGWRGLVPHHRLSQGVQNGSPILAVHPPVFLRGPGGVVGSILQAPVDVSMSSPSSCAPGWGCCSSPPPAEVVARRARKKRKKNPTKRSLCPSPCPLSRCCKFSLVFCNLMIYSQEKISLQFTKKSLLI